MSWDADMEDPHAFWEHFYLTRRTGTSGKPSGALLRYAGDLPAGTALDLGSSHGDDVLWLAARGWQARGVDISATVIDRATRRAADLGLAERARFEVRDLAGGLPEGRFDLVSALYLQSPVELPRAGILREAASRVAAGGHLLVVAHAAPPPWAGDEARDAVFPTVKGELEAVAADPAEWATRVARVEERTAVGPDGAEAVLQDTVLMLRRNQG